MKRPESGQGRRVPEATTLYSTLRLYPLPGTVVGQGTAVAVSPPPADVAPVGWSVTLTSSTTVTLTFTDKLSLGAIEIRKLNEAGRVINLPGATFTIDPNPYGIGVLTVVDNDPNDGDLSRDTIQLKNVSPSSYTIIETVAPTGYLKDPVPKTVKVTAGAMVTVTFTNKMLGELSPESTRARVASSRLTCPAS